MVNSWAIGQVSGRKAVHGPVYYSRTLRIYIANKTIQKIYHKNNVQVIAKYNVQEYVHNQLNSITNQQREFVVAALLNPS